MDILAGIERLPPLASLAPISLLAGVGMLWVFRRFSDQARVREVKRQLSACLYELRLFADEPRLVWRAQTTLLAANLRYVALMLRPALVLALPMAILFVHLDTVYAWSPLALGETAIVTVQMSRDLDGAPLLEPPEGIRVESPPVRVLEQRQVSWRVRPVHNVSGSLRIVWPDVSVEKTIDAGAGALRLSTRRTSSFVDSLLHPAEERLPGGAVDWIAVRYPPRRVSFLRFQFHWMVWFLLLSSASVLLLKRWFRVTL